VSKLLKIVVALFLLCVIPLFSVQVAATSKKQVVLILADYLSLNDLTISEAEFLQALVNQSLFGLMNVNSASARTSPGTHATISAGRPAYGGNSLVVAAKATEIINNEAAGLTYRRYTDNSLKNSEVCILNWPQIIEVNNINSRTKIPVGLIGESLKSVGLKAAVIGNSDLPERVNRPAALITADFNGITPHGLVGNELLSLSEGFLPWITNYEKLIEATLSALKHADFLVVDTGDLSRLEDYSRKGLEKVVAKERKAIIKNIDDYLNRLFNEIDFTHTLLILTSSIPPSSKLVEKNYLVPIVFATEYSKPGLIYSNTTRREGLITSADLTTTILDYLNANVSIANSKSIGQSISGPVQKTDNNLDHILRLNHGLSFIYQIRPLFIKPYIILQIITIIFSVSLFFIFKKIIPLFLNWLSFIITVPLALLIMGAFRIENYLLYALLALALGLAILIFSKIVSRLTQYEPFVILGLITSFLIVIDLFLGSGLMKHSVLGYDPIIGARFYGIGNEYMGVLIGSSFLGVGSLIKRESKRPFLLIGILYFIFIIWLIFSPDYGANFGGTVAAVSAFLFWVGRWIKDLFKNPKIIIFTLFLLILLMCFGNLFFSSKQSHIEKAFALLLQKGNREFYEIVVRKIEMNIKLILYTNWSKVFLLALLSMSILFFKPRGFIQYLYQKHRSLYESFTTVLVGSVAALLFNDSGIVAASTAMIYAVYPLLSLALKQKYLIK